ncbi:uncharacterized protein OCT59_019119 [Rhizophagus irregularis]|uniref:F-box domain-containing protein n=2 Tax=Rhizophagus irregularis TaxID=588596 RepID=A0A015KXJ9_RHIIW|nr:hypothetical protein GLOIN_2v1790165 [Rhizophagus irregularis DAOM 181602=DAOM 197198]EXX64736.1 hypothetical protein RirG_139960 [Rhizophagus irregularis DAOM 197198w]POG58618.1 hypothetical protein GLOIN_2v1790165 [Rhizophagus irregularis DAOM 181602=DAOM 197198]UZO26907.1 hypothetical protein OCT59_019119 [Rhizophagus irregularis]GET62494.1 hypothetical protein GLOIN_2v1790165 [Rhizophagus irregularis DAOM 181602=DAOM 197198]|eukprot:XP_025165484.1 hypothetical protein GLOIN_2v1790165 [Rhizophagus irregularis DAOM 181602=DAOM 197198]
MSSSKIFSEDLLYKIIKYFPNDHSTLHSCVLVNRLWCRLAIPLLWENPFSIPTGNFNFIEVYLYNLDDHLKAKLNEYTDYVLLPSNTLFNYPSFIRYLNINKIVPSIEKWLEANNRTSKFGKGYLAQILDSASEFIRLINISIFKLFVENEVKLNTLEIETSSASYNTYVEIILEIILQNPNFIHSTKNLKFSILSTSEDALIKNHISQILNLHQNLKRILLGYNNLSFYRSLLLLKGFNCSNTLNTITFYHVDFKGIMNFDKVLEELNVLESVHLIYCSSLNTEFAQQIINLTKPFKLKSLFISEISLIESLQLLLQISGDYLENFGCGGYLNQSFKQQILELIIKHCKNIKYLDVYRIDRHDTSLIVFSLIKNIKQNLNHISISVGNYQDYGIELLLQNLVQALPSKLEYLSLDLCIRAIDFKVFLKNSQDTFFKKLVISNIRWEGGNYIDYIDILPYVKEYIMKNKRVEYLAIKNTLIARNTKRNVDLFDLKDEVMEFKLHNIKVLSYIKLSTDIYRFLNEID